MKKVISLIFVPALAGCLTSTPPQRSEWSIPTEVSTLIMPISEARAGADYGIARLSQLIVRAPYDVRSVQVLRADGTIVSDPYNHFAATPSQLLKGAVQDTLSRSPRFTTIVASSSSAAASHVIEVTISKLQLDCSTEGSRWADVELSLMVLNYERKIVWAGKGKGYIDAKDGNYGNAFAEALKLALDVAMGGK